MERNRKITLILILTTAIDDLKIKQAEKLKSRSSKR